METSKAVLGFEHPTTLNSAGNMAFTYMNQGRWAEAEKLDMHNASDGDYYLGLTIPPL
jgi:Tetratricopeptide repeat